MITIYKVKQELKAKFDNPEDASLVSIEALTGNVSHDTLRHIMANDKDDAISKYREACGDSIIGTGDKRAFKQFTFRYTDEYGDRNKYEPVQNIIMYKVISSEIVVEEDRDMRLGTVKEQFCAADYLAYVKSNLTGMSFKDIILTIS